MNFYVYIYLRLDGSPYYVGKGCNGRWKRLHGVEVPPADRVIFPIVNTTEEWAHFMEMDLINAYGRLNDGTGILENLTDGGEGGSGRVLSEETKQKIGVASKGKVLSEETRRKMSESRKGRVAANKGIPHSEETKQKISNASKGENNGMHGKKQSDETKQKISDAIKGKTKGKPKTEDHKRKMSEAAKNRKPISEETRRKMSEAAKNRKPK